MLTTRREFLATTASAASYRLIPGANDRVRVGFIGYGLIGRQHVHDFKAQPDVELAAVSDVYRPRLEEGIAACGGLPAGYDDFRRLLDDKSIDAVVISTPDHWHALMTILACSAGKDVYVEKPMTLFVREGRWMVNAARRHNRIVQVGTQQRSGKHYQRAIQLLRNGYIGKVHSVRIGLFRNIMPGFGSPPDSDPPPGLNYDLWLGPAPRRAYNPHRSLYHFRWFWDYSGGQMTNYGAHDVDVIHWAMQVKGPLAVCSSGGRLALQDDNGETPDTQDALFEYPGGFTAVWSHREASVGAVSGRGMQFFGTKGGLSIDRGGYEVTPDMHTVPQNQIPKIMGHPVGGPTYRPDLKPEPWTQPIKARASNELFSSHVRNFIDCVKSRQAPLADVEDGHRTVTACHLANISLRLGRKIRWDAEKEQIVGDPEAASWLERPYRSPWDKVLKDAGVAT